jgi:hypothetical protein
MTTSLFAKAKADATTTKSKTEKHSVLVTDEQFPNLKEVIRDFNAGQVLLKETEGQVEMLKAQILNAGREVFTKECVKLNRYVGSFNLVGENGAKVMIVPMDKYTKVEADKYAMLLSKYGSNFVKEKTEYSFNPEVLERNMEAIEMAIMNCPTLSDLDKANLIIPKTTYEIAKGTIEGLHNKPNPTEALLDFSPIIMIKNV